MQPSCPNGIILHYLFSITTENNITNSSMLSANQTTMTVDGFDPYEFYSIEVIALTFVNDNFLDSPPAVLMEFTLPDSELFEPILQVHTWFTFLSVVAFCLGVYALILLLFTSCKDHLMYHCFSLDKRVLSKLVQPYHLHLVSFVFCFSELEIVTMIVDLCILMPVNCCYDKLWESYSCIVHLPGSSAVQNLSVVSINSTTFNISFITPSAPNGIIAHYNISISNLVDRLSIFATIFESSSTTDQFFTAVTGLCE